MSNENIQDNAYIEKDAITITRKLVKSETENSVKTRIPYTKEYVSFPKSACEWISDKTMKIKLPENATVMYARSLESIPTKMTFGELKVHYDEVIRHYHQQVGEQTVGHNKEQKIDDKKPERLSEQDNVPGIQNEERDKVTSEERDRVLQETRNLDDFTKQVYRDTKSLQFYPEMMRGDMELNNFLTYRNQQQIFADDYTKRNEVQKVSECQQNIKAADALIAEKTGSAVQNIQQMYKPEMEAMKNTSPVSLNVEEFKRYPADLQRSEEFKQLVLYKAQLEDLKTSCINSINANFLNYQNALAAASPDVLLQYERNLAGQERQALDRVANLTNKINNVSFAIDYQVSQYQSIKPAVIPPIGEQMNYMNIKTLGQAGRMIHSPENLIKVGNPYNNLRMYQTKDGLSFVGRSLQNGKIEQLGKRGNLKDISKSYKNHISACKQEMKLENKLQKQQAAQMKFSGRGL